jgi:anti-sigma regulatory factor (Ser/Thr protein kinase)
MRSNRAASSNGEDAFPFHEFDARSELLRARATCQQQAVAIDRLGKTLSTFRRGVTALKAENSELRAENDRLRCEPRSGQPGPVEVTIALNPQASGAARSVVARHLGARVVASELHSAQLIVSELVANSVQHSNSPAGSQITVSVELTPEWFRVGVQDPGSDGVIMARAPNLQTGGGLGLALVQRLSERWGVERLAGGTKVWAQLARSALETGDDIGTNGSPVLAPRTG